MTGIVFGSDEARAVIQKDAQLFGPKDKMADAHEKLHRYKIEATASVSVRIVSYVWAHSEAAACAQWQQTAVEQDDIEEVLSTDDWGEEEITDMGEG